MLLMSLRRYYARFVCQSVPGFFAHFGEGCLMRTVGARYQSLSEIARLITGTRWSGPLFFGIKNDSISSKAKEGQ